MVTVLFVGAVMTVTVSAAAFIAVQEFRAAGRDRGATSALALSEAGVDRTIQWMRSNSGATWRHIVLSGCGSVAGTTYNSITLNGKLGTGTYETTIQRADACPSSVPSPREPQEMILRSTGCTPNATAGTACPTGSSKRVVEQTVAVSSRPIPVGMSGNRYDFRGTPSLNNIVAFARGVVNTRRQITVAGSDPYYTKSDFYPCIGGLTEAAAQCFTEGGANDIAMPASVHSTDRIFLAPNGTDLHPPSPNCTNDYDWDGSATGSTVTANGNCGAFPTRPPTTLFTDTDYDRLATDPRLTAEDHLFFRQVAQQSGLYCSNYGAAGVSCTRAGVAATVAGSIDNADVTGLGNIFVVYIEYPAGTNPDSNMLTWSVTSPAPTGTACTTTTAAATSILVVVRNGGFENNQNFMGAVFAEDGRFEIGGNTRFEGTVAASFIRSRGSPTICNSQRWLDSMPTAFLQVAPLQWSEVDR